ncbi:leukocyte-associated immunoglobulin-like receptor 1 isoform X2 [Sapajus apella]|uniref:Leukocyte-associated immunoglobulin-like receptor 1 isoform X2 n=1 Tax=Sapajus apella TaxID=9515 RepID=A0A6J3H909_SAPAP|nr:leukocyte-associated immunoglobulin-like receptor 1 isoform X2 [Sapajus apella]
MSPHPTALLGLVLCLAQTIHMQEGALPRPSISAEPGTVIPRGSPVTFVCRGPAGVDTFRLEWENRSMFNDAKHVSQLISSESEATFRIDSVSEDSAGRYHCLYHKASRWSQHSEQLELMVKGEDATWALPWSQLCPRACPQVPGPCPSCCPLSVATLALLLTPRPSPPPLPLPTPPLCPHAHLGPGTLVPSGRHRWPGHSAQHRVGSELPLLGWVGSGFPEIRGQPPYKGLSFHTGWMVLLLFLSPEPEPAPGNVLHLLWLISHWAEHRVQGWLLTRAGQYCGKSSGM